MNMNLIARLDCARGVVSLLNSGRQIHSHLDKIRAAAISKLSSNSMN